MPRKKKLTISKIRRSSNPRKLARRIGIILNADGSVFDKKRSRQFHNLADWYKEAV